MAIHNSKRKKINFRPRRSKTDSSVYIRRRGYLSLLSWETSLIGWSNLFWDLKTSRADKIDDSQRFSLVKILRKNIKKKGNIQFSLQKAQMLTSKPLGIRMGKGKGKFLSYRWFSIPGKKIASLSLTTSSVASSLCRMTNKKTSTGVKVEKVFF